MSHDSPTRVLLADDHPLYREGLAGLMATTDDLQVVAQAANGRDAVLLATSTRPDVAVLDVAMPELDGVAAARQILAADPDCAVLMVTMLDGDDLVFEAMKAHGSPWWVDSLNVESGETFEVLMHADNPGIWMDQCHKLPHAAQGLVAHLAYDGVAHAVRDRRSAPEPPRGVISGSE